MGHYDIARGHFNGFLNDRHNEALDDVLLFVVYPDAHMSAFFDLVGLEVLVSYGLVVGDRPMVAQEQHSIEHHGQNHHTHRQQVFFIGQRPSKLVE